MSDYQQLYYIVRIARNDFRIVLPSWLSKDRTLTQYPPPWTDEADIKECLINDEEPSNDWEEIAVEKIIAMRSKNSEQKYYIKQYWFTLSMFLETLMIFRFSVSKFPLRFKITAYTNSTFYTKQILYF